MIQTMPCVCCTNQRQVSLLKKPFKRRYIPLFCLICLLLCEGALATSRPRATREPIIAPIPTLMPSEAPPDLGTTPPELMPDTTPMPRHWLEVGPVSFDADLLTQDQREDIIGQLQQSIMFTSMANDQLAPGQGTTRQNPCFLGQSARFRQTFHGVHANEFAVTMTLTNIIRGEEAEAMTTPFLSQITTQGHVLGPNLEFVVCAFDIIVQTQDAQQQTFFSAYDFQSITESGRSLPIPILLADEDLSLAVGPGSGKGSLTVILPVEKDRNATILYRNDAWFSVMEPDAAAVAQHQIEAGHLSFDANRLTLSQRADIIRQLQDSIITSSLANYQMVSGLETTRHNPCFFGQSARFRQTFSGAHSNEFMVTMTLVNSIRGAQADAITRPLLDQITSKDDVLAPNLEFVVCEFEIIVLTEDNEQQSFFSIFDFETVSETGRAIQSPILLADADLTLFLGPGSGRGTLTVILPVERNRNTVIRYQDKVWFSFREPPS